VKRNILLLSAILALSMVLAGCSLASSAGKFPEKHINLITYVGAGGGMDVSCRKFVQVAAKYTDATIVVENRTGAGGIIAQDYVLGQPADGYTLYGITLSNIATIVSGEHDRDKYVDEFDWIALLIEDPVSVIITNKQKEAGVTFNSLMEEAKAMGGKQIWVGPSTGGTKHIDAMKIWEAFGVECVWVPFESGPLAMNALLSGQGAAATGNPFDTAGRELWNAAVASEKRMPGFEDTPTFAELGYPQLNKAAMWRGFAVKKGTPDDVVQWIRDLCQKVTEDEEWIEFHAKNGINVVNYGNEQFRSIIGANMEEIEFFLKKVGLM